MGPEPEKQEVPDITPYLVEIADRKKRKKRNRKLEIGYARTSGFLVFTGLICAATNTGIGYIASSALFILSILLLRAALFNKRNTK